MHGLLHAKIVGHFLSKTNGTSTCPYPYSVSNSKRYHYVTKKPLKWHKLASNKPCRNLQRKTPPPKKTKKNKGKVKTKKVKKRKRKEEKVMKPVIK